MVLWFKVAVVVFQTTRKLTRSAACGRNRRDLQVVFTSLDDAVCICFCTGMTPSVCAVLFAWWRVLSHPVRCGCFRCDVRETGSFFFPQGVQCTDSVSSRRVLLLLLLSLSLPLSLFFESCCELFFCFGDEKKKNSVRWFWQRWCNCAGEILEVDCCEQCERLSLLTHARERTLTGRKGKKEKKNAQSQESLLTVFSLCADYVPLFLFFLEFSNIWDPFWQVVFLFFLYFWWTSRDSVVWCCGEMPRCTSANCVTRWLLLTLRWLRCVPGWCGQKGMPCTMFTYQVLVYAWNLWERFINAYKILRWNEFFRLKSSYSSTVFTCVSLPQIESECI